MDENTLFYYLWFSHWTGKTAERETRRYKDKYINMNVYNVFHNPRT